MKQNNNDDYKDDSTITLYALGQLTPEEAKEFEMKIENDSAAQKEVEEIRQVASSLREGLEIMPKERLDPDRVEIIYKKTSEKSAVSKVFSFFTKVFMTGLASILVLVMGTVGYFFVNQDRLKDITDKVFSKADGMVDEIGLEDPSFGSVSGLRDESFALSSGSALYLEAPSSRRLEKAPPQDFNTEAYDFVAHNEFISVADHPLSTFSTDVDTASYANARRFLNQGRLPPKESIRVEEFINYFDYSYAAPSEQSDHPIAIHTEVAQSPFRADAKLVKVALKAQEILDSNILSNMVFLIDVSGSMGDANKLPLAIESIKQMVRKMDAKEMISFVVYAGNSGVVLPPTYAAETATIFNALNSLQSGGSTNGEAGIVQAYQLAKDSFIKDGNNRVVIITDGDFNVGNTSQASLIELIKEKAQDNIFLTVLGFGMGNYKDSTLEKMAAHGNGNYAYIDNLSEAKKVLINDRFKTLHTIAKDVKLQIEFNPQKVEAYRLIGYENRLLEDRDFNDDKKDAGEMGAGHTVTAFYEILPKGAKIDLPKVDKLKYQEVEKVSPKTEFSQELMTVKIRYKKPTGLTSSLLSQPVSDNQKPFSQSSSDFQFASAVAGYAMLLREDKHLAQMNLSQMLEIAEENKGEDRFGYREEFIENMRLSRQVLEKNAGWK